MRREFILIIRIIFFRYVVHFYPIRINWPLNESYHTHIKIIHEFMSHETHDQTSQLPRTEKCLMKANNYYGKFMQFHICESYHTHRSTEKSDFRQLAYIGTKNRKIL